jgi:hypothetical protein
MGDRVIHFHPEGGYGGLHLASIDASSTASGACTQPRTVAGTPVFVAPEDAAQLDRLQAEGGRSWSVARNGSAWSRVLTDVKAALGRHR